MIALAIWDILLFLTSFRIVFSISMKSANGMGFHWICRSLQLVRTFNSVSFYSPLAWTAFPFICVFHSFIHLYFIALQNSPSFYDMNPQQIGCRGNVSQHKKILYTWCQTYYERKQFGYQAWIKRFMSKIWSLRMK